MTPPPNTTCDIVAIGAGIAGLICAEQLRQAGFRVVVVEKSRGFGGRAATKRLPDFRADHGLRYLERSGRLLPIFVDALSDRGIFQPWEARFYRVGANGAIEPDSEKPIRGVIGNSHAETPESAPETADPTRYIAPSGANAIGKFLAQNLDVWRSRRAVSLEPEGDRWRLGLEAVADGVDAPLSLTARCVVAAIPAPQATDLIAHTTAIAPEAKAAIAAVSYHPSISVMAGYPAELAAADRAWDALQFDGDRDLFWAGVESSKRHGDRLVLTLHAAPEFAAEHFDAPDLDAVGRVLLDRLAPYLPALADRSPDFLVVHRWRYAFVETPFSKDCLSLRSPLPIAFGGDWCGTEQAETALRSGLAMAAAAARSIDGRSLPSFADLLADLPGLHAPASGSHPS